MLDGGFFRSKAFCVFVFVFNVKVYALYHKNNINFAFELNASI